MLDFLCMRPGGSLHPIFGFWPDAEVTEVIPTLPVLEVWTQLYSDTEGRETEVRH